MTDAAPSADAAPEDASAGAPPGHCVELRPIGWRYEAAPGLTVLQAAARSRIRLPSSCRNGTCRTCMCRMLQGAVRYGSVRPGLSAAEKEEGWILPCVAVPEADLVLEVHGARTLVPRPPSSLLTGARRT